MTIQQFATFETGPAKLNATSKLVKAWESKNAKNAAKGAGFTLMAVSLSACGSDTDTSAVTEEAILDAIEEVVVTPVPVFSALQTAASGFLTSSVASDVAVATATITAASAASVMAMAESGTTAPATQALAIADMTAAITNLTAAMETTIPLEASNAAIDFTAILGGQTFALALAELTAVTAAEKTALATTISTLEGALSFETTSDAQDVLLATQGLAGAATSAAEALALGGISGITSHVAANLLADTINTDTGALATAGEIAAANAAYAALLNAAVIANNSVYATEYAALTAAQQGVLLADIQALIAEDGAAGSASLTDIVITRDAGTGAITGAGTDAAAAADDITAHLFVAEAAIDASATVVTNTTAAGTFDPTADAVTIQAYVDALQDQQSDAALIAAFNGVLESMKTIATSENAGELSLIQSNLVSTESLGADSIDVDGGAATDGNDIFIFSPEGGVNQTIGTAAAYLGESGTDSVIIGGDYTFVSITKVENDAIATTALGDATATEIFVYQNATTGDAVLHVEDNAFDGSLEANGALTTLTLTDVTFTDLVQITEVGFTGLETAEAIIA
ncbi:hypothetical protein N8146_01100 [Ascidiaceihabitans sp.]|nr:hypothetical protein [Ascidiaceihabitans sp.]